MNILCDCMTQKMFCAESIASDEDQHQNHVYNLLVTLRDLSANKLPIRAVNMPAAALAPRAVITDKSQSANTM